MLLLSTNSSVLPSSDSAKRVSKPVRFFLYMAVVDCSFAVVLVIVLFSSFLRRIQKERIEEDHLPSGPGIVLVFFYAAFPFL